MTNMSETKKRSCYERLKCEEISKKLNNDDRVYKDLRYLNKYYDRQIFEAKKKELPWNEQQELELAYKADHSDDLDTDDSIDGEDAVDKFIGILKDRQHNMRKK